MLTLSDAAFDDMVTAAVRAPSLHNSQPWRFRHHSGAFELFTDRLRTPPIADPTGWGMRIACGAAALNAKLALAELGLAADVQICPDPDQPDLAVRIRPVDYRPASAADERLYKCITHRFSNRAPFWPAPVDGDARSRLIDAAEAEGAWVELFSDTASVYVLAEIARAADDVLSADSAYREEMEAWRRPDGDSRDGVPVTAGGFRPTMNDLLPNRGFGDQELPPGMEHEAQPLVVVLGTPGDTVADQLTAGMALQRVLLTADADGLSTSLFSQAIEVPAAREQLRIALGRQGVPQMLLRVGHGRAGLPTARREPADVIDER